MEKEIGEQAGEAERRRDSEPTWQPAFDALWVLFLLGLLTWTAMCIFFDWWGKL